MKAFFITQPLRMHEGPDRAIADLETTLCQFANQTAEREVAGMAPLAFRFDRSSGVGAEHVQFVVSPRVPRRLAGKVIVGFHRDTL